MSADKRAASLGGETSFISKGAALRGIKFDLFLLFFFLFISFCIVLRETCVALPGCIAIYSSSFFLWMLSDVCVVSYFRPLMFTLFQAYFHTETGFPYNES